jgi:hypothetical protein
VLRLYFLCFLLENASSQTLDFRGKRDLRPYFALGVEKCHRRKNKALERKAQRKILTNLQDKKLPSHLRGGVRGGVGMMDQTG